MGYTREERPDIGRQIYNNELSKSDAAIKYSISEGTARDYMRLYRDVNSLPPKNRIQKDENTVKINIHSCEPDLSEYESMTKEELMESINGWIKSELFTDFHLQGENVREEMAAYIKFFNEERPAYSLGYLTPKQYRETYAAY